MKKLLYLLVLVISCTYAQAQQIPEGYKFVGQVESTRVADDGQILVSLDGKYVITEFSHKPSTIEVYEIRSWKKVQSFNVEGLVYFFNAFFDKDDSNTLYMGTRGRKMYKLDFIKGTYEKVKSKNLAPYTNDYMHAWWRSRQPSSTIEEGILMRMLPGKYVTKMYSDITKIYIWEGLLDQ